jgi:hypothetical protein
LGTLAGWSGFMRMHYRGKGVDTVDWCQRRVEELLSDDPTADPYEVAFWIMYCLCQIDSAETGDLLHAVTCERRWQRRFRRVKGCALGLSHRAGITKPAEAGYSGGW